MTGIDFIGDIHGRASKLRSVLSKLGYRQRGGAFRHPQRTAVFLGDLLNRGPAVRSTVRIVRPMVESGSAICLLGNHEAFALQYRLHTQAPGTYPLPSHKACDYLAATRQAYRNRPAEWRDLLNWLWERPLFLDTPAVRAIHACWHPQALHRLGRNRLSTALFRPGNPAGRALWQVLEGPSVRHPATGIKFRIRWWERRASTWADFAYSPRRDLPVSPLPHSRLALASPYSSTAPPCFFGHYGFSKPRSPILPNLACLDFGVAQGGPIGVYRWCGERTLLMKNFIK